MHDWPTIVLAAVGVLGVIVGFISWIYKRGKQEQILKDAIEENTHATAKLTQVFENFSNHIRERLEDHEVRITVLEKKP